jgi:DNA-binding NarL/FixJ family response regulator
MTQARRRQVFKSHLSSLGEDCQQVLKLFFEGKSLKEIAGQMGFTAAYAKKRKFICQQKLIASIEQDVLFRELTEY